MLDLTCKIETETVNFGSSSRVMGSKRVSFNALVKAYSFNPEWRFISENVPMQPRRRRSRPVFHVTKSGLKEWKKWWFHRERTMNLNSRTYNAKLQMPKLLGSTWRSSPCSSLCKTSKQKKAISGTTTLGSYLGSRSDIELFENPFWLLLCGCSCDECPFWSEKNFLLAILS